MTSSHATRNRCVALATLLLALAGLVAAAWLSTPRAGAVAAPTALRFWNEQRAMHGFPAGLILDDELSDGCRKHNSYQAQNGLGHDEVEGNPGYTPEGDAAGNSSVLGQGAPHWNSLKRNPWENAPLHLAQTLDPRLKVTGFDQSQGFVCATTLSFFRGYPQRTPPPQPRLFTYPGPGTSIYRAQHARESPLTPGQVVGIPQGTRTGPHLVVLVFAHADAEWDAHARITRAWLKAPSGRKLAVAVVDDARHEQIQGYIAPGGFVIPRKPLRAGKRYTAHVRVSFAGKVLRRTWRFEATRRVLGFG